MTTLDLTPVTLDLVVYVGDANEMTVIVTGETSVDLTGATITAQARLTASDATVAISADVTLSDPTNGVFLLAWDGEDLRTLVTATGTEQWRGVWDVQVLESGDLLPWSPLAGTFTAKHDVTRAP